MTAPPVAVPLIKSGPVVALEGVAGLEAVTANVGSLWSSMNWNGPVQFDGLPTWSTASAKYCVAAFGKKPTGIPLPVNNAVLPCPTEVPGTTLPLQAGSLAKM